MGKKIKIGIGICVGLLLAVILVVGGYVVYMQAHFYRIPDHTALAVENNREAVLETGHTYTAVTYMSDSEPMDRITAFLWIQVK